MKKLLDEFINILFPPMCEICGKLDKDYICNECLKDIEKREITQTEIKEKQYFNEHMYLFDYKSEIRKYIINYKFYDKTYLYIFLANIIIKNKKVCEFLNCYDIITPVPMHYLKKWQRGYNQTALIARKISIDTEELEYIEILKKIKNTKSQSSLNKEQRLNNVQNVYRAKEKYIEYIKNKNILIFDDVYTTGSTVNECAKELNKYTKEKIGVLTIAKDII